MKNVMKIKIRYVGDTRAWEDMPTIEGAVGLKHDQVECMALLAELVSSLEKGDSKQVQEVRWNWAGSYEGHYLSRHRLVGNGRFRIGQRVEFRWLGGRLEGLVFGFDRLSDKTELVYIGGDLDGVNYCVGEDKIKEIEQ